MTRVGSTAFVLEVEDGTGLAEGAVDCMGRMQLEEDAACVDGKTATGVGSTAALLEKRIEVVGIGAVEKEK